MGILTLLRNAFGGRSRKGAATEAEGAETTPSQETAPKVPSPAPEPTPAKAATVPEPRTSTLSTSSEHELVAAAFDKAAASKPTPSAETPATPKNAEIPTQPVGDDAAPETPVAEESTPEEPVAKDVTVPETAAEEPATEEPAAEEPVATDAAVQEPAPAAVAEEKPLVAEVAPEPEPVVKLEPEATPEPETKPEPAAEVTPDSAVEPEAEPVAEAEPDSVQEPEPEPVAVEAAQPVAEVTPEPEPASDPEPETVVEPEPQPAAEVTPEPEPEPAVAPETPAPAAADDALAAAEGEDKAVTDGAGGNDPAVPPTLRTAYTAAATALTTHELTGTTATTYLVLDRSASMRPYYKDGSAQALGEQTLALAAHLDPESKVHVVFFSTELDGTGELTLTDHENKIDDLHAGLGRMGRTSYHAAVEEVLAHHTKNSPDTPALVVFQTDGAPDAKTPATQALTEAAKTHPTVFFSFVAFGDPENKAFDYLRKLKLPNTSHFLAGETPKELTDAEIYEGILANWRP
ncbi:Toxic cation resistance protein [Streptomyces canus]|uniref:Toxic cation resistance protein n=1 Tax=Streptomyces canus TaxID=58343 RepID=A0A117R0Z1_9ACTN|nr:MULTISPECIES: VWA domain-containing protein [Streptomyces]KUN65041.1 Toxic cation resistance protein [Streptomyces canus]MDI5912750.1 VWA domain-containing protein [Streptomyces sp. 12257]